MPQVPPTLPVIVFSPGGFHAPECFDPTGTLLTQAGYEVHTISLPSIGPDLRNEPPPQDWGADVAAIRDVLLKYIFAGRKIVLVAHSYGGLVGSEACRDLGKEQRELRGLKGGVVKLVYLSGMIMDIGHSAWKLWGEMAHDTEHVSMQGDLCYLKDPAPVFFNECGQELREKLLKNIRGQAWKPLQSTVTYTAWRDIPGVYVVGENDRFMPPAVVEAMLQAATAHRFTTIERCDGDHSYFASQPEFTSKVIRKAAVENV